MFQQRVGSSSVVLAEAFWELPAVALESKSKSAPFVPLPPLDTLHLQTHAPRAVYSEPLPERREVQKLPLHVAVRLHCPKGFSGLICEESGQYHCVVV